MAAEIREGIAASRWQKWLPQERRLADELHTSRSTLRKSLSLLKEEGLIEPLHGTGSRILTARLKGGSRKRGGKIVLLTPGGVDDPRPLMGLAMDTFLKQLLDENYQLHTVESPLCYGEHPERALAKLVEHHAADCWILYLSSAPMQHWFLQNKVPAVIMGSCYRGVDLPFVDTDHRALCRHAANMLIQAGHRRFMHLTRAKSRGGDLLGEEGFDDAVAVAKRAHPDIEAFELQHQGTVSDVVQQLRRVFRQERRPTAVLISQSAYYLTIICELAHLRLSVPEDVSIITGIDKPFFKYLHPVPASYTVNQAKFFNKLLAATLTVVRGGRPAPRAHWLLPTYCPGVSLRKIAV